MLGLQIDVIEDCNLKCDFCVFHKNGNSYRNGRRMAVETVLDIADSLKEADCPVGNVNFVGRGEPLLNRDLPQMVSAISKVLSNITVTTNGILLTVDTAEKLLSSGVRRISVSVTGSHGEGAYLLYQGSGQSAATAKVNFDKVKKNIGDVVKMKNRLKMKAEITVSYILAKNSQDEFFEAVNMWRELGVNNVDVRPLTHARIYEADDFAEYIDNIKKVDNTLACCVFGNTMQIDIDGNLHYCCNSHMKETLLGNIHDVPVHRLLTSNRFKELEMAFHGKYERIPLHCRSCDLCRFPVLY